MLAQMALSEDMRGLASDTAGAGHIQRQCARGVSLEGSDCCLALQNISQV